MIKARVDYRVRPAKHVERLMLADGLRRLHVFHPLSAYRYIGMGAQFFVDFSMFHRMLGINLMTSLESDSALFERCVFNRPFDSVTVTPGASWDLFASMDFAEPTIVWMDYTGKLDRRMLGDVDTLILRLPPTSLILVTVNVDVDQVGEPPIGRRASLEERVGATAVPHGVSDSDLDGWNNASVARQIFDEQVRTSIVSRADDTKYMQLFNFNYRDSARMLTVGGILWRDEDAPKMVLANWQTLDAFRPASDALSIELPTLTMRELAHLDKQLPTDGSAISCPGLNAQELESYASFYRYYPRYALVDV
jgi:hypothetical protein